MKLKGTVKGQSIVFDEPLGLPEGQSVEAEITRSTDEDEARLARREMLAKYGITPIPAGGTPVTNEMVNEIREELGI